MKKIAILSISVIMVLVAAAILIGFTASSQQISTVATIYVADEDGNVWSSDVNLDGLTFGEQTMLAFGGIRSSDFKPLSYSASTAKLFQYGKSYTLWASVTATIDAENMESLDAIQAYFKGYAGQPNQGSAYAPNHASSSYPLLVANGDDYQEAVKSQLSLGEVTLNQDASYSSNDDRFSTYKLPSGEKLSLTGDTIDGAKITVEVVLWGTAPNGVYSETQTAELQINVDAWDTAKMSVQITGMSAGNA